MRCTHPGLAAGLLILFAGFVFTAEPDTTRDEKLLKAAKVGTDGPGLIEFFRTRTLSEVDAGKIRALIKQLGNDNFETREKASQALIALGSTAVSLLEREGLKDADIEIVRRSEECLRLIKSGAGAVVEVAAARLLAVRKPAGAVEVLLAYLPFASHQIAVEEVHIALAAVAVRDGQPDKALVAALADATTLRRIAAGVALSRAGQGGPGTPVRKLLQDADLTVRFQVARSLAEAREKDAVPVLIDLLVQLPAASAWQAEDVLFRIEELQVPAIGLAKNDAERKKCRDAWADWWAKSKDKADLAKLQASSKLLGYTMIVQLDAGRVLELDGQGKELWRIENIQYPLDAQLLPDHRLLVAEHSGNLVTERDRKGEIVWKKELTDGPLVAQRLANGNTFIATRTQLQEVDRTGKEVWTYTRQGEQFRKAQKLRNGDCVFVTSAQQFFRISPSREVLQNFPVDVMTNGGRVDVLPNGHVLVPLMAQNKLVEYDIGGKPVWDVNVDEPVAAVGLRNGHVLITSLNQQRAVEVDRLGKEVWEYKADTRVTRAWRR